MKPKYYYINKYIYFPPFFLWVWLGNKLGFDGVSYFSRYKNLEQTKTILGEKLNDTLSKIK